MVLLASIWILSRNLRRVNAAESPGRSRSGLAAMIGALALHGLGYALQQTRLSIAACLIFAWGVIVVARGRQAGPAALFPLAFLLLAMPVNFLDSLGFHLRLAVSGVAERIAHGAGLGVIRNGTQLFAPDGHYQYDVTAACSGVRSLVALFALALLLGYLYLRTGWARALLVVLTLPFAFAGNVVRITAIVFVGEGWGHAAGQRVHDGSGAAIFIVVLGLLLAAIAVLRKWQPFRPSVPGSSAGRAAHPAERATSAPWTTAVVVAICASLVVGIVKKLDALPLRSSAGVRLSPEQVNPADLPPFLGSRWVAQPAAVTAVERSLLPPDTGYSRKTYVAAADPQQQVFVSIVLSGRDRTSIHRPELCLVGQGWTIAGEFARTFRGGDSGGALPATVLRIEREATDTEGRRTKFPCLFAYFFVSGDEVVARHRAMLWQASVARLRHFRADRWAYVVVQTTAFDGEAAALARIDEVLDGVWPEMRAKDVAPAAE
jgi:exosortase